MSKQETIRSDPIVQLNHEMPEKEVYKKCVKRAFRSKSYHNTRGTCAYENIQIELFCFKDTEPIPSGPMALQVVLIVECRTEMVRSLPWTIITLQLLILADSSCLQAWLRIWAGRFQYDRDQGPLSLSSICTYRYALYEHSF